MMFRAKHNKQTPLTFGSLFAGIGGLDLGLERAGLRCAWQVEIDDYCRQVLARHWPHVPRFNDVREVGASTLAPVDVLAGGFPCQDLSNSGRRAGIEGARSGLWKEFDRLIGELKPPYVLIENVAALLQRNNRFDVVLRDLAARGYDARWDVLPAGAVGAPHLRERVFVLAHARGLGRRDELHEKLFGAVDSQELRKRWAERTLGPVEIMGRAYPGLPGHLRMDDWAAAPLDENERPIAGARIKGCGNAVVPQVAEHAARGLLNFHHALTT